MREVPVQTNNLFISDDGHSFTLKETCEKYEELLNKYHNILKPRYKLLTGGDGRHKHCYWVESYDDAKELMLLVSTKINFHGKFCQKTRYDNVWLVFEENEDYLPPLTLNEFIEYERECEKSYRDSITAAVLLSCNVPND